MDRLHDAHGGDPAHGENLKAKETKAREIVSFGQGQAPLPSLGVTFKISQPNGLPYGEVRAPNGRQPEEVERAAHILLADQQNLSVE